jgi:hypothetical protein
MRVSLAVLGVPAEDELGAPDQLEAIEKVCADHQFDDIIVATLPRRVSRWLRGHKDRADDGLRWGVEAICAVLREQGCQIAGSRYYEAAARPRSRRELRDEDLKAHIAQVLATCRATTWDHC